MLPDAELQQLKETVKRIDCKLDTMDDKVDVLDDLVRGDSSRHMSGLLADMLIVETFIDKWNKREYMIRGAFLLLSSNIVLTLLAIGASFLGG